MDEVLVREVDVEGSRRALGEAIAELQAAGAWKAITKLLRSIPIRDALEAVDAFAAGRGPGARPLGVDFLSTAASLDLTDRIDGEQGAVASAILDRWSQSDAEMPHVLAQWAFVALARAGLTCGPAWERHFPFVRVGGVIDRSVPAVKEAARTLSPARVFEVTKRAMERGTVAAPSTALCVLGTHDDEALARLVLDHRSAGWDRERVVKALEKLGDRPGIQRAIADTQRGDTQRFLLQVASRSRPTSLDELDPLRREQLRIAGERFDGRSPPLESRLVEDPENGAWAHLVLADEAGRPRYDAWLVSDSGTYFDVGTTTIVAEHVQGAVTGAERALADALDAASRASVDRP
ncbi:MAG: hypothetical protein MUE69_24260 [Myxococcota bacterium]|jgi:hypothetical protein|nr:hypothetical protein [Myxococcota bacterium]